MPRGRWDDHLVNRQTLVELLDAEGVDRDAYSVDLERSRMPDECLCLLIEDGGWVIFYSERGAAPLSGGSRLRPRHATKWHTIS
jgi:hypothetical protein